MIRSITLLGSSSGRNAGDAALLSGIMDSIDSKLERRVVYEIPTIRPNYVWHNYNNKVRPISMLPWSFSLKMAGIPTICSVLRSDLVLVFDAILFDRSLYNPLFNYLSTINLLLPTAKRFGQKLGFYNVGVGPIKTAAGAKMIKNISDLMDFITVRDQESLNLLRECGVSHDRIALTADAAICVRGSSDDEAKKILAQHGLRTDKEILAVNISKYIDTWAAKENSGVNSSMGKEAFVATVSESLKRVLAKIDAQVAFICTQHHDVPLTREIMDKTETTQKKAIFTNIEYNHYQIKALLSHVSFLVGMRLHATILATASFTPALALPHQPKVSHYFKRLGLEDSVLEFDSFSVEALTSKLLECWEKREATRTKLKHIIPILRAQADHAADFVAALDEGKPLEALFAPNSGLSAAAQQAA